MDKDVDPRQMKLALEPMCLEPGQPMEMIMESMVVIGRDADGELKIMFEGCTEAEAMWLLNDAQQELLQRATQ